MPRGTGTDTTSHNFERSNSMGQYGSYLALFEHLLIYNTHNSGSYALH